jgi:glycine amidinotransferase
LREIVVGRGDFYSAHQLDVSFKLFHYENLLPVRLDPEFDLPYFEIPQIFIDELQEDLEDLVDALTLQGIIVHRPAHLPQNPAQISTPLWSSRPTPALNIRDQTIILGDTILETAPQQRARYFENDLLKPVFYQYLRQGARWVSMPKPSLGLGSLDPRYYKERGLDIEGVLSDPSAGAVQDVGYELMIDGAQCLRLGRDVLVNVANQNHELAFSWLKKLFGERFRFHRIRRMAANHIDTRIVPLRPGLMLVRSPEIRDMLPHGMRNWEIIQAPATSWSPDYGWKNFYPASRYIDMNVLSVNETTVIVNSLNPDLARLLEKRGFDVVEVRHRHGRLFGGGFHCFTLDTVRTGELADYLG